MYDRYIPIQTLIITLLRNVILTVPEGAWTTCGYFELLHLPTQMRFLIGGERVTCRGLNLSNSLRRIKLTNSLGKQQLELWTRT